MTRGSGRALAAVLAGALIVGCSALPTNSPSPTPFSGAQLAASRGGTLRVVVPRSDDSGGFRERAPGFLDPQLDWSRATLELTRCCLARTLFSYNGRSTEKGGSRLRPDLAEALPDVSSDGLTWTIRIKQGLRYGPPLQDIEITAPDFVRSFRRLLSPALNPYGVSNGLGADFVGGIVGAEEYGNGAPAITGLEVPDAHTLRVRLEEPDGDFAAKLAELGTAPLPPDPYHADAPFGTAQGADDGYGRFLVSSGPYVVEGSEALDFSVPAAGRTPVSGIAPGRVVLVRNPEWKADSDALRPAYADRIEISVVDSVDAAVAALDDGRADLLWSPKTPPTIPADTYAAFASDPSRGHAYVDPAWAVRFVIMNLGVPPFDDVHVRRAMNYALDKRALVDMQGGSSAAGVIGHLAPDVLEDDLLLGYDPYATTGDRGDIGKAMDEMRLSGYDRDRDGRCDAPVCAHVRTLTRDPFSDAARAAAADLQSIGINLEVEVAADYQTFVAQVMDPRAKVPVSIGLGFFPLTIVAGFLGGAFYSRWAISDDTLLTGSIVGATAEQLQSWGYEGVEPINVDDRIEPCIRLVGTARFQCWAAVDQYLMEYVVPWVPYSRDRVAVLASPRVLTYDFAELSGGPALDRIAVKP